MRHIGINPHSWTGLQAYGRMDSRGVFHVNKEKIRHEAANNLENYKYCPALNVESVLAKLDKDIPDKINPKQDKNWEYVTEYDDDKEKEIAVSVKKKVNRGSGYAVPEKRSRYDFEVAATSKKARNPGCMTLLVSISLIVSVIIIVAVV